MLPLPPGLEYPWARSAEAERRVELALAMGVARARVAGAGVVGALLARQVAEAGGTREGESRGEVRTDSRTGGRGRRPASAPPAPGSIDLNHASVEELQRLPRVGPAMAERIVAGRPYRTVGQLRRVRGIGDATFRQIEPLVRVGDGA
jgi:DNA uptake protein ComE-like DNA-binding protein